MIVDAHQHFWDPARGDYGWLKPQSPIHRPYCTQDLRPLLVKTGVDATILVQAAPTVEETDFMLGIARRTPWVLGVVGWIDLLADNAAESVRQRAGDPLFVGVRPMLQDLEDPDWIRQPCLDPALNAIAAEGLVFDALIRAHQIDAIAELASRHPQLPIVLDHAAKPRLGDAHAMSVWALQIERLAHAPNVVCKVSGLLTELPAQGERKHVTDAISILFDLFGANRLLWGSDWPVLTLVAEYADWFELVREAIDAKHPAAADAIMGRNALRIYRPRRR